MFYILLNILSKNTQYKTYPPLSNTQLVKNIFREILSSAETSIHHYPRLLKSTDTDKYLPFSKTFPIAEHQRVQLTI